MPLSPFGLTLSPNVQPLFECWAIAGTGAKADQLSPKEQRQAELDLAPLFRQHGFPNIKGDEAVQAIRAIRAELLSVKHMQLIAE